MSLKHQQTITIIINNIKTLTIINNNYYYYFNLIKIAKVFTWMNCLPIGCDKTFKYKSEKVFVLNRKLDY